MKTFDGDTFLRRLLAELPQLNYQTETPLAPYTTVKIGGPAELLLETKSSAELATVVKYVRSAKVPLTILGWGANTLISDAGIRGVTIINKSSSLTVLPDPVSDSTAISQITHRWHQIDGASHDFFDYYSGEESRVLVECESGTPLPFAINQSLQLQLTGLEWFSRIPATIGGAIYNNVHGGTHFISDQIYSVLILDEQGKEQTLKPSDMEFDYDYSRFHHTKEIILAAKILLFKGDVEKAKAAAIAWAQKKHHQPQKSLGCVFQNISQSDQQRLQLPTTSIGYLIDKVLRLSGYTIGGAQISKSHAAFIENIGNASAMDYLQVIEHIQSAAKKTCNITLKPEIFFRGFSQNDLSRIQVT
jgi:UDP-N-acetylmuramate dehydrogenase